MNQPRLLHGEHLPPRIAYQKQQPTVRGLGAIRNHCTIAHISVLLLATAAHHLGHPDKLAFVRSFVPNFLIDR